MLGRSGVACILALRFLLQPLVTLLLLLPVLLPKAFSGRWYSCFYGPGNGHVLNRLLILTSVVQ